MNCKLSNYGVTAVLLALACSHASGAPVAGGIGAQTLPALPPSGAATQQQTVQCQLVDDDVLSHQTGKYAGSDMISGFVLSVLSQWQMPNGATAVAQGSLSVTQNSAHQLNAQVQTSASVTGGHNWHDGGRDGGHNEWNNNGNNNWNNNGNNNWHNGGYNGGPNPQYAGQNGGPNPQYVGHNSAPSPDNTGANPNASVTGGQNVAVNGISQITQVAGNSNTGSNAATIAYSNTLPQLASTNNQTSAYATNANGSVTAGISFANNSINLSLQTPAGVAAQSITPSNAQQAGAIAQLLQIAGNNQQVANRLALTLQTQQMSASMIRQAGLLQALRIGH